MLQFFWVLFIFGTSLEFIPEYAIEFNKESQEYLNIEIHGNSHLNSSGFHENSLSNIKRPVYFDIGFYENKFEYLDVIF